MKAVFWTREERETRVESDWRETNLAEALQNGAHDQGDEVEIRIAQSAYEAEVVDCDLVCMAGVKSRFWFKAYAEAGIPWLYFDKGYIRERAADQWLKYWRMSVNAHHPIEFLANATKSSKRADSMGFRFAPWRENRGPYIVLDGGSEKNFKFNGIVPESATVSDVDAHCHALIKRIEQIAPTYPVIYRPKPSSKGRQGIAGSEFAYKTRANVAAKDYAHDLERAHAVVTYNGAISYDANRMGIPSIVLGSAPARPISSTKLEQIWLPRLASKAERQQWINNLAWCQFTPQEIAGGVAWEIAREMMDCTPTKTPAEACPCTAL